VLLSRPFWMWGAEMGTNQHGVAIGNEAVFTTRPPEETGLTGMDLVRLGLERGASARQAVDVIVELLGRHGQGGGCGHEQRGFRYHSSFLVADPRAAFVLETAGREWAVEEVSGVRTISNGLTIEGFAERHSDRIKTWGSRCRVRQRLTEEGARRAVGVADLMAILRSHGEGGAGPAYDLLTGGLAAPCVHPGGLAAGSQTTASWVADLRRDSGRHWVTATAAPCTGLFKPVRSGEALDLGPTPTDVADPVSLWWRHERLHRRALRNPQRLLPLFTGERDEVERRWLASPPAPAEAFAVGDRLLANWTAAVATARVPDSRPMRVRRFWRRRDRVAHLA
jgi:dipeptidase